PSRECALERFRRALEADVGLRRREHHLGRRLRLRFAYLDIIAGADPSVGALQPVEADDVDAFVFAVGPNRAGRRRALADNLDDVPFSKAEVVHELVRQAGEAAAAVGWRQARNLDSA